MCAPLCASLGLPIAAVGLIRRWRTSRSDSNIPREERLEHYERVSLLVSSYEEVWYGVV